MAIKQATPSKRLSTNLPHSPTVRAGPCRFTVVANYLSFDVHNQSGQSGYGYKCFYIYCVCIHIYINTHVWRIPQTDTKCIYLTSIYVWFCIYIYNVYTYIYIMYTYIYTLIYISCIYIYTVSIYIHRQICTPFMLPYRHFRSPTTVHVPRPDSASRA